MYFGKASLAWFLEGGLLCESVCMFQRRLLDPLEMELKMIMNHLTWVVETN